MKQKYILSGVTRERQCATEPPEHLQKFLFHSLSIGKELAVASRLPRLHVCLRQKYPGRNQQLFGGLVC